MHNISEQVVDADCRLDDPDRNSLSGQMVGQNVDVNEDENEAESDSPDHQREKKLVQDQTRKQGFNAVRRNDAVGVHEVVIEQVKLYVRSGQL
jgi:hypothetical protein